SRSSAKERSVAVRKACVETPRRPAGATGLVPAIADSVPKSWRTAFRCGRQSVRDPDGTLSAMPPEWCPPSVRNPVRHGPERAALTAEDHMSMLEPRVDQPEVIEPVIELHSADRDSQIVHVGEVR